MIYDESNVLSLIITNNASKKDKGESIVSSIIVDNVSKKDKWESTVPTKDMPAKRVSGNPMHPLLSEIHCWLIELTGAINQITRGPH